MAQLGAADQRVHPRDQLGQIERLGEVIVGAAFEPPHPCLEFIARGQHQHRGEDAALAKLFHHGEPVPSGEHDVEDDAVVAAAQRAL